MFDPKLTNNLPNVNNPMPFSVNNRWGGNYPWMPNFKFPPNPLAQAGSPHTTKADAQGIQQAMQKRSEQEKAAMPRGLGDVPSGIGPQQMNAALTQLQMARALVDPTSSLNKNNLSKPSFEKMIDRLANKEEDSYNFSDMKKDPTSHSALYGLLGALAGGGAGMLTGNKVNALAGAALGGLGGAGYGYHSAGTHNKDLKNTANVLKEYGLLKPEYLRQALPLLKTSAQESPYRSSATGESKNIKFKHDVSGHATGQSAFDSLDGYMKKAGLNSFQSQFFTRLIKAGLDENQIKAHITKAGTEFGEKVAEELNDGFEKLGYGNAIGNIVLGGLRSMAPRLTSFGAKQVARKGITKGLAHTAGRAIRTTPQAAGQAVKNTFTSPQVRGHMATGAITGIVNPYTGAPTWRDDKGNIDWGKALMSVGGGTLLGRGGGRLARNAMRRGMVGEGIGYTSGWGARLAGHDVDPMQFARYGFAGGAMTPRRLGNMLPKATTARWAASSPLARRILKTPLTNIRETGVLNRLDLPGQAFNLANKGIRQAARFAKANPGQALTRGALTAGGVGMAATPFAINSQLQPLIDHGQQTMYNVDQATQNVNNLLGGGEGGFMGNMGQIMKDNPWLLPALLGGVGIAGGGLLGGQQGATLGGIGLPLIYLLASGQGQQMLGNIFGIPQQDDVSKVQSDLEQARGNNQAAENVNQPVAEVPENKRPEVSELQRQQQAQLDAGIQALLNLATPEQIDMIQDPNITDAELTKIINDLYRQSQKTAQ